MNKKYKWIFLGTPDISVYFLEKLKEFNLVPDLVITNPDALVGRKKVLTPSPVALWAKKNKVEVLKPKKINEEFFFGKQDLLNKEKYDFFFVLAYGKILPKWFLELPKHGIINLHPSLLPKYRGPSPIMSAILDDQKETGISLMLLDEEMDHGPIITQEKITIKEWQKTNKMEKLLAEFGAELFYKTLLNKSDLLIKTQEQNHDEATYCQKYTKADMELTSPLDNRQNFLKYCAFSKPFYFDKNGKRNIVTEAKWENNHFIIEKIIPEGKKERNF